MQEVSQVSGALNDRSVGRWVVALAVTAALMVGGGFLGSVGSAQAGGEPDSNVGSPGGDGQSVTCYASSPRDDAPTTCDAVGGDGEDGEPGAVYDD
jgi:hypothetical protein